MRKASTWAGASGCTYSAPQAPVCSPNYLRLPYGLAIAAFRRLPAARASVLARWCKEWSELLALGPRPSESDAPAGCMLHPGAPPRQAAVIKYFEVLRWLNQVLGCCHGTPLGTSPASHPKHTRFRLPVSACPNPTRLGASGATCLRMPPVRWPRADPDFIDECWTRADRVAACDPL